ncbi:MAG TPA: hypothetical protein ENJ82_09600 [Bacteroidetes bacterium]|nr:hypothetical protein [Bacteroidota bacterium]
MSKSSSPCIYVLRLAGSSTNAARIQIRNAIFELVDQVPDNNQPVLKKILLTMGIKKDIDPLMAKIQGSPVNRIERIELL